MAWTFTIADVQPALGNSVRVVLNATDGTTNFPRCSEYIFPDGTTKNQALAIMQNDLPALAQNLTRIKAAQTSFLGAVVGTV